MWEVFRRIACDICGRPEPDKYKPTVDVPSPRDIIPTSDIIYYVAEQKVEILNVGAHVWLTTVADTNSMDPTVDAGHTCILIKDFNPEDLQVGDVVVYTDGARDILHRIIEITEDAYGRKFKLKGDNNHLADPYIIRKEHIRWLLIGIIY